MTVPKEHNMNRRWHLSALAAAALVVAGCGGGNTDSPLATRVVSFGDSLSDLGTYAVATEIPLGGVSDGLPPYLAGRFTTNTHTGYTAASNTNTAAIWVEWVAAKAGVPITQAMFGFATFRRACPAAATVPALADTCTAYGQGGSRVTNPNGVNKAQGALTDPLVTQVAAHLTKFGSFDSRDLVFVFAGGNDLLINLGAVQAGGDPAAAVAAMAQAGTELAALITNEMVAKGAARVALLTLSDLYVTSSPFLSAADPPIKDLVTRMIGAFNTAALAAVDGGKVRLIDTNVFFTGLLAQPSAYGITNVTTTACDPDKVPPAVGGSALFCNGAAAAAFTASGLPNLNTLRAGADPAKWLYADGLHPTTGGHKALADYVIGQLKNFDWLPDNL
jgi:phospholipase/lecithinase/hemolysin